MSAAAPAPAVLLDLDGTLVDSRAAIVAGVNATLQARGLAARPAAELIPFIGPPLHVTFGTLLGLDPADAALDDVVRDYRERYGTLMLDHTPVFDGIPEALDALAGAGCVLAVATSKARPLAARLLEGLGLAGRFAAILGPVPPARDDKATTVGQALQAVGLVAGSPEGGGGAVRAVMVGDRLHDVEGAHAHGLPCVGVLWGIGDADELRAAGAAALCATPAELPEVVLGLGAG